MPPTERLADSGSWPTLPWHARPAGEVLEMLGSGNSGLTAAEARSRLARQGLNRLTPPRRHSPLARFLGQFHNVL
ncbi:MAG TPA: cation-transporting P-type ATPase, partial [Gammaproteobacteria bacterium]|nr:cation-transporting P-type ATPase [Gammaproteobacteria bacterium]